MEKKYKQSKIWTFSPVVSDNCVCHGSVSYHTLNMCYNENNLPFKHLWKLRQKEEEKKEKECFYYLLVILIRSINTPVELPVSTQISSIWKTAEEPRDALFVPSTVPILYMLWRGTAVSVLSFAVYYDWV